MVLTIVVHAASIQDRDGAKLALKLLIPSVPRLYIIWADGGYAGKLVAWTQELAGWFLSIVKKPADQKGFAVLPKRWIVERTFAWLGRYRRLSKDYEELVPSSEAMVKLAMINLMVHRLSPG